MFGFKKKPLCLQVSAAAYDELANMLGSLAINENGVLDLQGIGLTRAPEPAPLPKHRPISKNTAPGAI